MVRRRRRRVAPRDADGRVPGRHRPRPALGGVEGVHGGRPAARASSPEPGARPGATGRCQPGRAGSEPERVWTRADGVPARPPPAGVSDRRRADAARLPVRPRRVLLRRHLVAQPGLHLRVALVGPPGLGHRHRPRGLRRDRRSAGRAQGRQRAGCRSVAQVAQVVQEPTPLARSLRPAPRDRPEPGVRAAQPGLRRVANARRRAPGRLGRGRDRLAPGRRVHAVRRPDGLPQLSHARHDHVRRRPHAAHRLAKDAAPDGALLGRLRARHPHLPDPDAGGRRRHQPATRLLARQAARRPRPRRRLRQAVGARARRRPARADPEAPQKARPRLHRAHRRPDPQRPKSFKDDYYEIKSRPETRKLAEAVYQRHGSRRPARSRTWKSNMPRSERRIVKPAGPPEKKADPSQTKLEL